MKRILSLVLASMLIVSLAACGSKSEQPSGGAANTPAATTTMQIYTSISCASRLQLKTLVVLHTTPLARIHSAVMPIITDV